jgi:hypothetical protein
VIAALAKRSMTHDTCALLSWRNDEKKNLTLFDGQNWKRNAATLHHLSRE